MYSVTIDKRGGLVQAPRNKITATTSISWFRCQEIKCRRKIGRKELGEEE